MKRTGNTILITGGGSGIGLGLAEAFHKLENNVIIAGRRRDTLEQVAAAHPGMEWAVVDVQDAQALDAFAHSMIEKYPTLNVLINNAGITGIERLVSGGSDPATAEAIVSTNILAPIRLTTALLPHLQMQPEATIINVGSGLAHVPLAGISHLLREQSFCSFVHAVASLSVGEHLRPRARDHPTRSPDRTGWQRSLRSTPAGRYATQGIH